MSEATTHALNSPRPSARAALVRVGGLVVIAAVASLLAYRLGWLDYRHTLQHLSRLRQSHSLFTFTLAFVAIYGIGTAAGIPGLPFTVAAGVLFGTVIGSVLAWAGAISSAAAGYWIARTIGHDVVRRWLTRYSRVDRAINDARDFAGMLRLRLIPVLPLGIVSFAGGLARAPFGPYMAATAIGLVPSTVIYTYFADSLVEGIGNSQGEALRSLIIASVLLIGLTLAPRLVRSRYADEAK
jgi:uncharacterized membrane protein YdjX (TVP38/TMEM64 family)